MRKAFDKTDQNRIRRVPGRGHYDRETVFSVIDAAWIGHVAFVDSTSRQATAVPMMHARDGEKLIFHGARSSRLMKLLGSGQSVAVSFALVDGLVLAKSLFHHSMNYRSAVVFGHGAPVESSDAILNSLRILSDKIMPGRWESARQPHHRELAATSVVHLEIESASAKVRSGDPADDPTDLGLPVWSGVLPLSEHAGELIPDGHTEGMDVPGYLSEHRERLNRRRQPS